MNADRRKIGSLLVALLEECAHVGEISDASHETAGDAIAYLAQQEFWQLRSQSKYEGQNATTDKQIAICRVALPALDAAQDAWQQDDFDEVIKQVRAALETDGTVKPDLRRKSK